MNGRVLGFLFILSLPCVAQNVPKEELPGFRSISSDDLRRIVAVLTSDSLEGRETSYPGQKRAAQFLADEFRSTGLKPVGDNGTYFQHFDVTVTRVDPSSSLTVASGDETRTYRWGELFVSDNARDTTIEGSVVFVGYADSELQPGADSLLAGKVVMMLAGKRLAAGDTSRVTAMRRLFAQRKDHGVAATLVITDDAGSASFDQVSNIIRGYSVVKGSMRLVGGRAPAFSSLVPRLFISPALAQLILSYAGLTLADARRSAQHEEPFAPVAIRNLRIRLESRILREQRSSENVVGIIEGSDPDLRNQVVVFSAHYDHLGINPKGEIFRGADDDASGTSIVVELARAFTRNPQRPRRSLLFLTVAGEEKGLLGSQYYTTNPIVPLERTMADLNIDMIGRVDTTHGRRGEEHYVYVIGSNKISAELDSLLRTANAATERLTLDYTYDDDADPEQLYRRSDHYNFARRGVPVAFFFTGLHEDYHQPSDTPEKILYDRMASIGRVIYSAAWELANFPRALSKNPGAELAH